MTQEKKEPKPLAEYRIEANADIASIIMSEYNHLREEIRMRIGHRHQLAGLSLTAAAALFSFAFSPEGSNVILFTIPVITTFLGIMTIYQLDGERTIGKHIQHAIGPRLLDSRDNSILLWDCDGERDESLCKRLDIFMMIHVFGSFVLPAIAAPAGLCLCNPPPGETSHYRMLALTSLSIAMVALITFVYAWKIGRKKSPPNIEITPDKASW